MIKCTCLQSITRYVFSGHGFDSIISGAVHEVIHSDGHLLDLRMCPPPAPPWPHPSVIRSLLWFSGTNPQDNWMSQLAPGKPHFLYLRLQGLNTRQGRALLYLFDQLYWEASSSWQVSKLTVCGVKLTFLQRKNISHFDSIISKVGTQYLHYLCQDTLSDDVHIILQGTSEINTTRTSSSTR